MAYIKFFSSFSRIVGFRKSVITKGSHSNSFLLRCRVDPPPPPPPSQLSVIMFGLRLTLDDGFMGSEMDIP